MSEIWIPITLCLSLCFVVVVRMWSEYKAKLEIQKTIRIALEQGQDLSMELTQRVGLYDDGQSDLRRAILLFSIGVAFAVMGWILGLPKVGIAVSILPLFLALAFFTLWHIDRPKK